MCVRISEVIRIFRQIPVYEDVLFQIPFLPESLIADVANENPVTRVHPQMLRQREFTPKSDITNRTRIRFQTLPRRLLIIRLICKKHI